MALRRVGIELDCLLELLGSMIVATCAVIDNSQAETENAGARIQSNGPFELGAAFLVTPHRSQTPPEIMVRYCIARAQLKGAFKFPFSS